MRGNPTQAVAADEYCLSRWNLTVEETSSVRMAAFFEKELLEIQEIGRLSTVPGRSHKPGYLPRNTPGYLTDIGVLKTGPHRGNPVDLERLEWCVNHPAVLGCIDPEPKS